MRLLFLFALTLLAQPGVECHWLFNEPEAYCVKASTIPLHRNRVWEIGGIDWAGRPYLLGDRPADLSGAVLFSAAPARRTYVTLWALRRAIVSTYKMSGEDRRGAVAYIDSAIKAKEPPAKRVPLEARTRK